MWIGNHDGGKNSGEGRGSRWVILLIIICVSPVIIAPSITADRHSFSSAGPSLEDACLICHVDGGGLRTEFGENTSSTTHYKSRDGAVHELDGVSKLCMSCHDGAAAGGVGIGMSHKLSSGLIGDHPVGVVYPPRTVDGELRKHYRTLDSRIILFGSENNQLSCATCHDPHENGRRAMLRKPVGHSDICLQCHAL